MDLMTWVRIGWTLASFIVFLVILRWAFGARARAGFEQAARLAFDEEPSRPGERHFKRKDR
jgi:cbb3-type cytochrome oxidase subunit 3